MNKLLEIKDKAVKFCGEYEHFILPVVRFAVAFIAFITIDLNIGYMAKISSMLVALLLALVCALLPVNAILWIASIMILLDMYALSIEVFAITFVLLLVLYFVYFRFAPKDGMLVILTPICFQLHIPSVVPVAAGLLRRAYSVVAIICGTLLYYFLDGIRQNASALAEVVDKKGQSTTKLNVTMGQLLDNKEMFYSYGNLCYHHTGGVSGQTIENQQFMDCCYHSRRTHTVGCTCCCLSGARTAGEDNLACAQHCSSYFCRCCHTVYIYES